jgi:hypothetical protein
MKIQKIVSLTLMTAVVLLLSGCGRASLPTPEIMKKETQNFNLPKLPEQGKALVYVVRPELLGFATKFNVYIDDEQASSEMGYTRGQQYIYFNVKPGKHEIKSLAENWASVNIDAKEGDIIFLEQEVKVGVVYARNALYNDYTQLAGKYRVKTLKLGTIIKADK